MWPDTYASTDYNHLRRVGNFETEMSITARYDVMQPKPLMTGLRKTISMRIGNALLSKRLPSNPATNKTSGSKNSRQITRGV